LPRLVSNSWVQVTDPLSSSASQVAGMTAACHCFWLFLFFR
jgi:hypothetical protein